PGLHVYARSDDGRLRLQRTDFSPSPFRLLVRHSALGRYLVFNLEALETIKALAARFGLVSAAPAPPRPAGNTAADASVDRVRDSDEASLAFFADRAKMVPLAPERIAFLVDGARYEGDRAAVAGSYFGLMRRRFMDEAARRGYEVIDLQPLFLAR